MTSSSRELNERVVFRILSVLIAVIVLDDDIWDIILFLILFFTVRFKEILIFKIWEHLSMRESRRWNVKKACIRRVTRLFLKISVCLAFILFFSFFVRFICFFVIVEFIYSSLRLDHSLRLKFFLFSLIWFRLGSLIFSCINSRKHREMKISKDKANVFCSCICRFAPKKANNHVEICTVFSLLRGWCSLNNSFDWNVYNMSLSSYNRKLEQTLCAPVLLSLASSCFFTALSIFFSALSLLPLKRPCSPSPTKQVTPNPKFGAYIIYI